MKGSQRHYLGRRLTIPAKSEVSLVPDGFGIQYYGDTVHITIGVGKDHTADLIMSTDTWEALKDRSNNLIITMKKPTKGRKGKGGKC